MPGSLVVRLSPALLCAERCNDRREGFRACGQGCYWGIRGSGYASAMAQLKRQGQAVETMEMQMVSGFSQLAGRALAAADCLESGALKQ